MLLKISQNSLENTCARISFLIKLQAEAYNFIKKQTLTQVFSYEFCEILRTPFLIEHLWWLLLNQGHWFVKQELFERHKPNICNVVRCFFWHQSSFLQNIPLSKQSKKIYRMTVLFDSCFSFYILSPWLY